MAAESTSAPPQQQTTSFHGGRLVARRLKAHGVSRLFTLSGRAPLLDLRRLSSGGDRDRGRSPRADGGVCGGGLGEGDARGGRVRPDGGTGGHQRDQRDRRRPGQPLADRGARRARAGGPLGAGLAAGDRPRAVHATAHQAAQRRRAARRRSPRLVEDAFAAALAPHGGPAFVDLPMDYVFMEAEEPEARREDGESAKGAPGEAIEAAGRLLGGAERPVIMAGTDLYWGHGEKALRELAEALCIPVFLNGLARGCVAADHELYFSRTRSRALRGGGRGARDRGADGLPAGLRGSVWGADGDRRDRRGRAPAPAPPRAGGGAVWVAERDPERSAPGSKRAAAAKVGDARAAGGLRSCVRQRRSCARASGRSCRTRGRHCIRCVCMPSWRRCWIATRS